VVSAARPPDSGPADGSTSGRGFRQATPTLRPRRADPRRISTSTFRKDGQRAAPHDSKLWMDG
jgi:hypothetical protein